MYADVRIDRSVPVPMRDGVVLRADVWRPADDERRPAIVIRTPYDRRATNSDFLRPMEAAEAGYVAVVQDTRGRCESEGDWAVQMWSQEGLDTHDTIEWAAQQSWCDGAVAMAGGSYVGILQWLGAQHRPPHLRAIAPAMTTSSELDRLDTGGAIRLTQSVCWLAFMALDWVQREMLAGRAVDPAVMGGLMSCLTHPRAVMEQLPLATMPQFDIPGFPITIEQGLLNGMEAVGSFEYHAIEVPTLSVVGFYDFLATGAIESFLRVRAGGGGDDGVRAAHRLIVGPWTHDGRLPGWQGEVNFGVADASIAQVSAKHLRFFDAHLKGGADQLPAVEYFLMAANEWRTADEWPPAGAGEQTLRLASGGNANSAGGDGELVRDGGGTAESDGYRYDPADPVSTHGGRVIPMGDLVPGPLDQRRVEQREDVLCYTSAPAEEPLDIVGPVALVLHAASDARDTDWVARLTDVAPDGRSIPFAEGIVRARYRNGAEELLEPGKVETYEIPLGHTAWRVLPGHRLRLQVTSSNFPAFDRNMNTGGPIARDADGIVATQTVMHSDAHPSALRLTVL